MPYKNKKDLYEAQKRHRLKVRAKLFEFLSKKTCLDCEENDPVVLEFDHKKRGKKFKIISNMLSGHYSWVSLEKEIEKCDIRCANCHRRKSYRKLKHFGRSRPRS